MIRKSLLLLAVVVSLSGAFSGCFVWNFVKEGYDNFSAYFNTYYNASQAYDDAMKDVRDTKAAYDLTVIAGAHPPAFAISGKAKSDFDVAIAKASKVLQLHPNSEFTEDCLYMIGISYYYEDDEIRGERKFLEAESAFPQSKRFPEAEMYYGAFELSGQSEQEGKNRILRAISLARGQKDRRIIAQSSDILADYYLRQEDTLNAAAYLDTASVFSSDDDAAAYACRAGLLFTDLKDYNSAEREFERAGEQAKDIRLKFYSSYYLARVHRMVKEYRAALSRLRTLRDDDKYFDFFPLIDYQEAAVLYDSGAVSTAVTAFQKIDTAYAQSEASTRSAYELAKTYLYMVGDFQTALKFYQRTASHPKVYSISDNAQQMAATLQEYLITGYRVTLSDSLYDKAAAALEHNDSATAIARDNLDTLYEHAAEAREQLAGLFMFKLGLPDSALKYYKTMIRDFPKSRVYTSALYTLGEYYYSSGDSARGKKYLEELVTDHPKSHFAISAASLLGVPPPVYIDSSQVEYAHAVSLFRSENYAAALDTLTRLLKNRNSALAPQALYLKGWIYETRLQKPDSAYFYYRMLRTEFPNSEYSPTINLALSGYETAERDSAAARQARLDSAKAVESKLKGEEKLEDKKKEPAPSQDEKLKVPPPAKTPVDSLLLRRKRIQE